MPQIPSTQTLVDPLDLIRQMTPDQIAALRSLLPRQPPDVDSPSGAYERTVSRFAPSAPIFYTGS